MGLRFVAGAILKFWRGDGEPSARTIACISGDCGLMLDICAIRCLRGIVESALSAELMPLLRLRR